MKILPSFIVLAAVAASLPARSEDAPIPVLVIKNHQFTPDKLKVKANERFKITVKNDDPTSEEFESKTIIVEKFIAPKGSITLTLGPLKPGVYDFFGDFHSDTAKGQLTAE